MKLRKTNSEKQNQAKPAGNPGGAKPTLTPDQAGKPTIGPTLGEIANQPKEPAVEPHITPFELAHTATQLALFYKEGQKPRQYLSEAHQLLRESAAFLENVAKHQRTYTLDELLQKGPDSESSKGKRAKTPLGGITTKEGLLKAIRREFDYPESERIIHQGCMTEYEIADLKKSLASRRSANARGSRKRRPVRNET